MAKEHNDFEGVPDEGREEDLEQYLLEGVRLQEGRVMPMSDALPARGSAEEEEDVQVPIGGDVQGALGLFAEAAQDMTTATVELSLGRHFACADYCNQVAEKAAQAVSLLRSGRRVMYNHNLQALGAAVGAPADIQQEMAVLTPFHPEAFYMETPPEEADAVISAEQASSYIQSARKVLRWARSIVLAL